MEGENERKRENERTRERKRERENGYSLRWIYRNISFGYKACSGNWTQIVPELLVIQSFAHVFHYECVLNMNSNKNGIVKKIERNNWIIGKLLSEARKRMRKNQIL